MMGRLKSDQGQLFYEFHLNEAVPEDHLVRKIDAALDLSWLRSELAPHYSSMGRPSIDPELMIRMLVVGYVFAIRSERLICREVQVNLAYRWFCRLGIEDAIPDHSAFSRARNERFREGDVFRRMFERVVEACIAAGLVGGEGFAVDAVLRLLEQGTPLEQITRRLNLARQTVRRIARGGGLEVFRSRVSILEPYAETLDALWTGGCRNGAELWRRLRIQGFQGSLRVVAEWATRRRLDESSNPAGRVRKTPSARKIARLMTIERDQVPRDQASIMAKIAHDVPPLLEARDLVDRFHEIMRQQKAADLNPWIVAAIASPLSSFAKGIIADRDAVQAAIIQPWSNGQTEGQITKLKLVKRQMYGRAKIDLLEARVIGAA